MSTSKIVELREDQFHDPTRGPFRVGVSLCKEPRFYRGRRVHVDAYGERFTIDGPSPVVKGE